MYFVLLVLNVGLWLFRLPLPKLGAVARLFASLPLQLLQGTCFDSCEFRQIETYFIDPSLSHGLKLRQTHCHREIVRANLCPLFVDSAPLSMGVETVIGGVVCDGDTHKEEEALMAQGVVHTPSAVVEANEVGCVNRALSVQFGNRIVNGIAEVDGVSVVAKSGDEDECSDETLYRINEQVFYRNASGNFDGIVLELADVQIQPTCANLGGDLNCDVNVKRMEVEEVVGRESIGYKVDDVSVNQVPNQWKLESDELTDEDNSLEAALLTKGVWDKGGIFFDSSDEEEVVATLTGRKVEGRKRSKKHRQIRNIPCI
ncbi:hypothetical protein PIB30_008426 [Stylosanthes scabra]|uniref:Uncharacterized protein n=1 Tax=Stylosanthes scabra TaxID=79078 RepID=A0ABU6W2X3_9FABA|nr:hypothetical protein [Stylosanthes scabra]